jgi:hypothetical protein
MEGKSFKPYITLCQEDRSLYQEDRLVCVILCAIDRFCLCPINSKKNLLRQLISCSSPFKAFCVVRDWPQKLNSIIEIKDTSRDLHSFALSLWISLVTSIAALSQITINT